MPQLIPEKLSRWIVYAQHIRKLKFNDVARDIRIHLLLLPVYGALGKQTLFPNLHTLFAVGDFMQDDVSNPILSAILGPSVRCISLGYYNWLEAVKQLGGGGKDKAGDFGKTPNSQRLVKHLEYIATKAPNVTDLNLDPPTSKPSKKNPLETAGRSLGKLKSLEVLRIPYYWATKPAMSEIEKLPQLRHLYIIREPETFAFSDFIITFKGEESRTLTDAHVSTGTGKGPLKFPSLLLLECDGPPKLLERLLLPSFPKMHPLQTLHINFLEDGPTSKFTDALAANFPSIKGLSMHVLGEPPMTPITESTQRFLASSMDLTTLSINSLSLSIADLGVVLDGWSNLVTLELIPKNIKKIIRELWEANKDLHRRSLPGLTTDCLGLMASKLDKLETLSITVVASDPATFNSTIATFKSLKLLTFETSYINYSLPEFALENIVSYLDCVLPQNTTVNVEDRLGFISDDISVTGLMETRKAIQGDEPINLTSYMFKYRGKRFELAKMLKGIRETDNDVGDDDEGIDVEPEDDEYTGYVPLGARVNRSNHGFKFIKNGMEAVNPGMMREGLLARHQLKKIGGFKDDFYAPMLDDQPPEFGIHSDELGQGLDERTLAMIRSAIASRLLPGLGTHN